MTRDPDVICCPVPTGLVSRCCAPVELVDTTADTLTEHAMTWRCTEAHEGTLTLAMTWPHEHERPERRDPITPRRMMTVPA